MWVGLNEDIGKCGDDEKIQKNSNSNKHEEQEIVFPALLVIVFILDNFELSSVLDNLLNDFLLFFFILAL